MRTIPLTGAIPILFSSQYYANAHSCAVSVWCVESGLLELAALPLHALTAAGSQLARSPKSKPWASLVRFRARVPQDIVSRLGAARRMSHTRRQVKSGFGRSFNEC